MEKDVFADHECGLALVNLIVGYVFSGSERFDAV